MVLEGSDEVIEGSAESSVACEEVVGELELYDAEGLAGTDDCCSLSGIINILRRRTVGGLVLDDIEGWAFAFFGCEEGDSWCLLNEIVEGEASTDD